MSYPGERAQQIKVAEERNGGSVVREKTEMEMQIDATQMSLGNLSRQFERLLQRCEVGGILQIAPPEKPKESLKSGVPTSCPLSELITQFRLGTDTVCERISGLIDRLVV